MEPSKEKPTPNPAQRAARNCCQLVIAVLLAAMLGSKLEDRLGTDLLAFFSMLGALACGVYALPGIRRYGRENVLRPALLGLTIHALLLLIFVGNFTAAREAARARQDDLLTPAQLSDLLNSEREPQLIPVARRGN